MLPFDQIDATTVAALPGAVAQAPDLPHLPHLPRARGAALVASRLRGGQSMLADVFQQGCLKVLFPRRDDAALTGVLLNTAGGLTGGDRLTLAAEAGAGSHLRLTTQAAERVYRATGPDPARVATTLSAGPGARLDWLPQETILFDRAALRRRLEVRLAADARFLMVEPVIFGRAAMGEILHSVAWHDRVTVWQGGALVFADAARVVGDLHAVMAGRATGQGAGALANLLLVSPDAEGHRDELRARLPDGAGASLLRPGVLFARIVAADGFALRRGLIPVLEMLNTGPLPRPWMM